MQTLTLRQATVADLAAVDALLASSYARLAKPAYPPSAVVTALPLLARAQPRLLASGRYYLAERAADGAVIGAGGWSASRAGRAEVRHLVTDWRHARQGIGRALLLHILDEARRAGAGGIDCLATLGAVPFYEALGFRATGPVAVSLRPGIDITVMRMDRTL